MSVENSFIVQNQIRQNSDDLQNYLKDLENWEEDMKKKEQEFKLIQVVDDETVPPVRNAISKSKKRNRNRKNKEKASSVEERISSFNYKAWENFDVDSELKKLDEEKKESSASESDKEEEFNIQRNKQLAIIKKDKGNEFFKNGAYDSAINSYTVGMELDPENALLAANRAMAFLKKEQFQAAENDCNLCLSLDSSYVKAYLRRGTARKALNKIALAKEDFMKVLELEPDNKQALIELEKINQEYLQNFQIPSPDQVYMKEVLEETEYVPSIPLKVEEHINDHVPSTEESVETVTKHKNSSAATISENIFDDIKDIISKIEQTLPPAPSTSYQFFADWKVLAKYPELKYQYLKQFPAENFPVVFKHSMEADMFPEILKVLSTFFIENGDDVFPYMKNLALVGRFNTMMLFLSDAEQQDINELASYIRISGYATSEIEHVLKSYKLC